MLPTSRLRRPLVALAFLGVAVPLQVRRCHGARRSADHVVQRGCVDDVALGALDRLDYDVTSTYRSVLGDPKSRSGGQSVREWRDSSSGGRWLRRAGWMPQGRRGVRAGGAAFVMCLRAGAGSNRASSDSSALIAACLQGDEAGVLALLQAGADPESAGGDLDFWRATALMSACHEGHTACALALLRAGADPSSTDPDTGIGDYETALMAACGQGHEACVQVLLQAGADPHSPGAHCQALNWACKIGHTACAQALLRAGADPNAANDENETALILACWFGHEACARVLLQAGADVEVDAGGNGGDIYGTALMMACFQGHAACVQALLQAGASPNSTTYWGQTSYNGETALVLACSEGHEACAQALLKAGADPKTYDQALASACEYARWPCSADDGHVACVHALLQAGADPSCGLMAACRGGHEALAQVLLRAGAAPRRGQL